MKKAIILLVCLLSSTFISFAQTNCNKLPNTFKSYSQAITLVKSSKFKINESANTSKSTWVKSATYYSCDGKTGYLIILLKNKEFRELRLNNPAKAKEAANLCLTFAKNMGNAKKVGEAYSNISLAHYYLTNIDSEIYYGNIAIEKCIQSSNQEYLSNTYTNLGNIESDKKNFEAAINYYEQSLIIQKQLNNDLGVGRDNNNIAGLYAANLNYAKSLEYRLIAQRYFEKVRPSAAPSKRAAQPPPKPNLPAADKGER